MFDRLAQFLKKQTLLATTGRIPSWPKLMMLNQMVRQAAFGQEHHSWIPLFAGECNHVALCLQPGDVMVLSCID